MNPLTVAKPTFQFKPPTEAARQAAASAAVAAYRRGEDVKPSPIVPIQPAVEPIISEPAPRPDQRTPSGVAGIDAMKEDEYQQFLSGTLTLVYDCPKQLTAEELAANIALYRQDPLFFEVNPRPPESAGVGK